ncbi:estradiol 17-beta-dehydrogenase 2 [Neoarius graeffei]|uniref:estradiol 17-beta-dehydrogenase 2 n=1 Tax=Neoarius graeffei TaxID=443677 RepID=UPI00298C89AC|nr:estradiol 17-beta-dehydrogenase 2 [Neoarius graeffei]
MQASGMELWLCVLFVATSAALLMVSWSRGHLLWSVGLVVVEVTLCYWVSNGSVAVILLSASCACCVIHFTAGRKEDMLPVKGKAVLITGCDSGFGHNLAKTLDRAGMKVYAGVLEESGPGARELREVSSAQLTVLQMDITNINQISEVHKLIKSQIGEAGLWGLVNNAGVLGSMCNGELLPMGILRKILNVNFVAGVEVTKVFLPLIRQAQGRIVCVSSMSGEVPMPGFAAYGASKAAVTSFFGVLRQELSCWGIKVAIIQPSGFKTNILGNQEEWNKIQKEIFSTQPQEVIDAYGKEYICSLLHRLNNMEAQGCADFGPVLDDLQHALLSEKPRPFYFPGRGAWVIPFFQRIAPVWLSDAIFAQIFRYRKFSQVGATSNK